MIGHPLMKDMPQWLEAIWLQRYLDRLLDDPESAWFESYALSRPELIDAIEADNDLRDAVALLPADVQAVLPRAAVNDATVAVRPVRPVRPVRAPWLAPMAQAAGLVLALFAGGWLNSRLNPSEPLPLGIASPTRIVFDTMRNGDNAPMVQLGDPEAGYVLIEVAVPMDAEDVRVQVDAGPNLPLVVSNDGFASFLLQSDAATGIESLQLQYRLDGRLVVSELPADDVTAREAKQ